MTSLSKSTILSRNSSSNRRGLGNGSPRMNRLSRVPRKYEVLVVIGFFVSFLISIYVYDYVLPGTTLAFYGYDFSKSNDSLSICNILDGNWIIDDNYPLYNATDCPFVEQGFDCLGNGREDKDYLKWRWQPVNCEFPRFDVQNILERLRSKRIVFVGDSMSRTQWESLICLLMTGVEDKKSVYEINGNKITKQIRFLGVRFSEYNFTVEFYRSVFLVQHGLMPKHAPKRVKSTLNLDKLDDTSSQWIDSDILIFNTGHWWVPGKLFEMGRYFQVANSLKLGMSIPTAFRTALITWASWIEEKIDTNRTHVFFRTFEPSHWRDRTFRYCNVTQHPVAETEGRDQSIFSDTILDVLNDMKTPVTVLHVTPMSASRSDAHVGHWSDKPAVPDCSHWCLPGVPDMWNEILLFYALNNFGLPYD